MLDRKPPFSNWRINPWHPLANGLRFYIVCGNGYAVDLVTGRMATFSGTYGDGTMFPDGQAGDFDSADYFSLASDPTHNILGDITLVWRGQQDTNAANMLLISKATFDVGANSPFYFSTDATTGLDFIRTDAAANFSFWRATVSTVTGAPTTYGVTNPTQSNASCKIYINGVPTTPSLHFSAGTGAPTGNTQPLRIGSDSGLATTAKNLDGKVSVAIGWDRQLTNADMIWIHHDPYGLIEMRPDIGEFTAGVAATTTPKLIGGNLIRPNLVRGRLAA